MKKLCRSLAPVVALVAFLLGTVLVGTAQAAHVTCGQTITQSTTLDSDVGPCPGTGIRIGASNITLDLGGRTVYGRQAPGEGAGILVDGRTGVTVRNGRVILFDAGVVLQGGSGNTVTNVVAQDNIGTAATDFGDGIAVFASSNNVIRRNRVQHNGPYSGISLVGNSDNNLIDGNTVQGNNIEFSAATNQDDGIRVEGPGVNGNIVSNNKVEGNGLDGIAVFAFAANTGNIIRGNTVRGNGFHNKSHRLGSGIMIFGRQTTIEGNRASRNAAFDLQDINPNCDANIWRANSGTRNQPCIN